MKEKKNSNIKETIKLGLILFLVVFFAMFFVTTKGKDELVLDFDFNFNTSTEDEFSFQIYPSDYNGEFRNTKGNGIFAFVGANSDGSYRVYFIEQIASVKNVLVKVDNATMKNKEITFKDNYGVDLKMVFNEKTFVVSPDGINLGNQKLEGSYTWNNDIAVFSLSEFQFYRPNSQ